MNFYKSKKFWYWTGGIVVLLLILYFMFQADIKAWNARRKIKAGDADAPDVSKGSGAGGALDQNLILKKGMAGAEVKELQRRMVAAYNANPGASNIALKLPKYGVDGVFGGETEAALLAWKGVKQIALKDAGGGSDSNIIADVVPNAAGG